MRSKIRKNFGRIVEKNRSNLNEKWHKTWILIGKWKFRKTVWEHFSWEQVAKPAAGALCVTFSWSCERSTLVLVNVTELIDGARYK